MEWFWTFALLALPSHALSMTLCDMLSTHNASEFCTNLKRYPLLKRFDAETANITVFAYSDIKATGLGMPIAAVKYSIACGIYPSASTKRGADPIILDTFVDDEQSTGVTGGQKLGVRFSDGPSIAIRDGDVNSFELGSGFVDATVVDCP